jgi:hypothetical protein
MIRKTVNYSFREYDSRITADKVQRAYFGVGQEHTNTMEQIRRQSTEMLGWIAEHMVLPTEASRVIASWALDPDTKYLTKTTIPTNWIITDPKQTFTNPKTGYTKHTRPCAFGVLGGMVRNLQTQRELTEPQIKALNHLFSTMISEPGDDFETLWPSHWTAYNFVHNATAQRQLADPIDQLFDRGV